MYVRCPSKARSRTPYAISYVGDGVPLLASVRIEDGNEGRKFYRIPGLLLDPGKLHFVELIQFEAGSGSLVLQV
jgi:hypothetical protein